MAGAWMWSLALGAGGDGESAQHQARDGDAGRMDSALLVCTSQPFRSNWPFAKDVIVVSGECSMTPV